MHTHTHVQVCMVPLLDMINHASPETANVIVHQDEGNGSYGCTATRAIKAGEEVRQNRLSTHGHPSPEQSAAAAQLNSLQSAIATLRPLDPYHIGKTRSLRHLDGRAMALAGHTVPHQ